MGRERRNLEGKEKKTEWEGNGNVGMGGNTVKKECKEKMEGERQNGERTVERQNGKGTWKTEWGLGEGKGKA